MQTKTNIKAEIVADSINQQGDRWTSLLITFPRIILSEVNTHRMLSKNTSSSRAIPFNKMVEAIENDPFIPIAWQKDHKGMQGTEYITDEENIQICIDDWLVARNNAIESAKTLNKGFNKKDIQGIWIQTEKIDFVDKVTKQLCNRLLEPWMWTTMLISGSKEGWDNFFSLRNPLYEDDVVIVENNKITSTIKIQAKSKKEFRSKLPKNSMYDYKSLTDLEWLTINKGQAEIHIMQLAECIYDVMQESTPKQLKAMEWHIPFGDKINIPLDNDNGVLTQTGLKEACKSKEYHAFQKVKISTAMAARTSYTVIGDEKGTNYERMIQLHDKLVSRTPPHCFTEGHEILTKEGWKNFKEIKIDTEIAAFNLETLKFNGWENPINIINETYNGTIYKYYGKDTDFEMTPNHSIPMIPINTSKDRSSTNFQIKRLGEKRIAKPKAMIKYETIGEQEFRAFSAPQSKEIEFNEDYYEGCLVGMFLGDGHVVSKNKIDFRLKKDRKIKYLRDILKYLKYIYKEYKCKDGVIQFHIDNNNLQKYYDSKNKILPLNFIKNEVFLYGIFNGLKNSDGSIKRKTWVYDTTSSELAKSILSLCPLVGLTGYVNPSYDNIIRISFQTTNSLLFNDSRKKDNKVTIEQYIGKIYCVEIPTHGIMIRRNGKTLLSHNSSPFEHCVRAMTDKEYEEYFKGKIIHIGCEQENYEDGSYSEDVVISKNGQGWCNNAKGFIPYRYLIDNKLI